MTFKNDKTGCSNESYIVDFSKLSMSARIEEYEDMLFRGIVPDLDSLLVGLEDNEKNAVMSELTLISLLLEDGSRQAKATSFIN